jgi:predicted Zn-dependent protease
MYNDYAADVVNTAPQTLLMRTRDGAVAGKTLLTDVEFSLSGVPGRAYTASDPDGWQYDVHEFLSGVRFYQLIITTGKGHTATRRDQFMNSFRIL